MNSLVIDMTHGGVKIAVSLAKKDETVYAYDIYNTLKSVFRVNKEIDNYIISYLPLIYI